MRDSSFSDFLQWDEVLWRLAWQRYFGVATPALELAQTSLDHWLPDLLFRAWLENTPGSMPIS